VLTLVDFRQGKLACYDAAKAPVDRRHEKHFEHGSVCFGYHVKANSMAAMPAPCHITGMTPDATAQPLNLNQRNWSYEHAPYAADVSDQPSNRAIDRVSYEETPGEVNHALVAEYRDPFNFLRNYPCP